MTLFDLPKIQRGGPISFSGESWFISNVLRFNQIEANRVTPADSGLGARIYGVAANGFGAVEWHEGLSRANPPTALNYLRAIGAPELELIQRSQSSLLIDISNEGRSFATTAPYIEALHAGLAALSIDPANCHLLTQNRKYRNDYLTYCRASLVDKPIDIIHYDFCPRRLAGEFKLRGRATDHHYSSDVAPRFDYLCMNFSPRPHRTGLVAWLFGMNFDARGLISYRWADLASLNTHEDRLKVPNWFPEPEIAAAGMDRFKHRGHLVLDLDPAEFASREIVSPDFEVPGAALFQDSAFSIVTESDLSDGSIVRITEKTFKAIAGGHPFIIVGNPGSLRVVKDYGFQSFSPLINEAYDEVEEPSARVHLILGEITRLLTLPQSEFKRWWKDVKTIAEQNLNHFSGQLMDDFDTRIERKILNHFAGDMPVGD